METKNLAILDVEEVIKKPEFRKKLEINLREAKKVLEFSLQKRKMVEILGWDKELVEEMEQNYIKFLALTKTLAEFHIDFKIIPNRLIDEFWHAHILDTKKYMEDCNNYFGYYLHHFPYYGMRNQEDLLNWFNNAKKANKIWKILFDEYLYENLDLNVDSYVLDKEFHRKLSELYKTRKENWAMRCGRCKTCAPQRCP